MISKGSDEKNKKEQFSNFLLILMKQEKKNIRILYLIFY